MSFEIQEIKNFKFLETKGGKENLILLHGLFGALSNFQSIVEYFKDKYNVIIPILPIFDLPIRKVSVTGLVDYVEDFVDFKQYDKVNVLGNSLGGHIALLYALARPDKINSIVLTGSSGLFESAMGTSFPKRGDYEFIRKKTQDTFYKQEVATDDLVNEVFEIVNDRNKAIRVVATAKSAVRHNLGDKLHLLKAPTLLVWGKQDHITPSFVGEKFHELIENSKLIFIDQCGHAPMMEHPDLFNHYLETFLDEVSLPHSA